MRSSSSSRCSESSGAPLLTPRTRVVTLFRATLNGFQEVLNPAGGARCPRPRPGDFQATLRNNETVIEYELSYQDLSADITQAHIHFGQPSTTGGIMVWLCQTPPDFVDPAGLAPHARAYAKER